MKLLVLTNSRADWSKLAPLVAASRPVHDVHVAVVGQHHDDRWGRTAVEIERVFEDQPWHVWRGPNSVGDQNLTGVLMSTLTFMRHLCESVKPDLLVVHGDRTEALAGALLALDGWKVAHVEGGERSGNIDDKIRDAVTAMAHLHFTSNAAASARVMNIKDHRDEPVFTIGSPEMDTLLDEAQLPTWAEVKQRYSLPDRPYGVLMLHPEPGLGSYELHGICNALIAGQYNWVAFQPNSDPGHESMRILGCPGIDRVIPSMRATYFARLLREASCIVGNSSAVVREAPAVGTPSILVGARQTGRARGEWPVSVGFDPQQLAAALRNVEGRHEPLLRFGDGKAAPRFIDALERWAA